MTTDTCQLECSFPNEAALYLAYMPFVKGGGLFLRTDTMIPLGNPVHLKVTLPNNELFEIDAVVVWITPKGAQNNKPAGTGVQFKGDEARILSNKIDTFLATMLKSAQMTHTM